MRHIAGPAQGSQFVSGSLEKRLTRAFFRDHNNYVPAYLKEG
ncbi:MAG: hypothetical protein ABTQ25_17720 [Nitrosomonas ureae]